MLNGIIQMQFHLRLKFSLNVTRVKMTCIMFKLIFRDQWMSRRRVLKPDGRLNLQMRFL